MFKQFTLPLKNSSGFIYKERSSRSSILTGLQRLGHLARFAENPVTRARRERFYKDFLLFANIKPTAATVTTTAMMSAVTSGVKREGGLTVTVLIGDSKVFS